MTTLCTSPRSMYCISATQSLLGLSGRFRKGFSHLRKRIGNRIPHHRTLPSSPLHEQRLISPHISLQHSRKIPRTSTDKLPAFLQYGRHTKLGTIFWLIPPDLSVNCSYLFNQVPHVLYAKLTKLGAEDMATRVMTVHAISEATQYNFNTEYLIVPPKHVRLPSNKENLAGIAGLENMSNPFKTVNIYAKVNIREIGSVASRQANRTRGNSALIHHPKSPQPEASSPPSKITETLI